MTTRTVSARRPARGGRRRRVMHRAAWPSRSAPRRRARRRPGAAQEPAPGVVDCRTQLRTLAAEMKSRRAACCSTDANATRSGSAVMSQVVIVGGSVLALMFVGLALFAIRRDFAGRARAEAELNRFFDLSIDLFVIASGDGYFKRMSPAVTDMLGYTIEEALAARLHGHACIPTTCARTAKSWSARCSRGERVDELRGALPPQGRQLSRVVVALDAAGRPDVRHRARRHRRRAPPREALREAKEQLERASQQRTRELAQANEVAAQERAALPRAHRARLRQHRADRRRQQDSLPEPGGRATSRATSPRSC